MQEACSGAVIDLNAIDKALSGGSVVELGRSNILAALCVVGGFTETLRIGSRVEVAGEVASSKTGTLVSFSDASDGTANVVLDQDVSRSMQKLPLTSLTAVAECPADPQLLPLTSDILAEFLRLLQSPLAQHDSSFCAFLRADLRSRCMQALSSLVRSQRAAEMFLHHQSASSSGLDALMTLARACEPSWSLAHQEQQAIAATGQLWDLATRPPRPSALFTGVRTVSELLPFFPFSGGAASQDILPSCLDPAGIDGAVFFGTDYREMYLEGAARAVDPNNPGRGGGRRPGGAPRKKNAAAAGGASGDRLILADARCLRAARGITLKWKSFRPSRSLSCQHFLAAGLAGRTGRQRRSQQGGRD